MKKEPCIRFCGVLISFNEVMNLQQSFEFDTSDVIPQMQKKVHPWFSFHVFANFMEHELSTKFYGAFEHFSGTYKFAKFLLIKLCRH